ncbi:hypothetical protein N9S30_00315 [bacterium]|nr:hypothetical protein [bacterium]
MFRVLAMLKILGLASASLPAPTLTGTEGQEKGDMEPTEALKQIAIAIGMKRRDAAGNKLKITAEMVVEEVKILKEKLAIAESIADEASSSGKRKREEEEPTDVALEPPPTPPPKVQKPDEVVMLSAAELETSSVNAATYALEHADMPESYGFQKFEEFVNNAGVKHVTFGYAPKKKTFTVIAVPSRVALNPKSSLQDFKRAARYYSFKFVAERIGAGGELRQARLATFWRKFGGAPRRLEWSSGGNLFHVDVIDYHSNRRKFKVSLKFADNGPDLNKIRRCGSTAAVQFNNSLGDVA